MDEYGYWPFSQKVTAIRKVDFYKEIPSIQKGFLYFNTFVPSINPIEVIAINLNASKALVTKLFSIFK